MNTKRGVVFWTAFNFVEANNEAASNQSRPGNGLFFLNRLNPLPFPYGWVFIVTQIWICSENYSNGNQMYAI